MKKVIWSVFNRLVIITAVYLFASLTIYYLIQKLKIDFVLPPWKDLNLVFLFFMLFIFVLHTYTIAMISEIYADMWKAPFSCVLTAITDHKLFDQKGWRMWSPDEFRDWYNMHEFEKNLVSPAKKADMHKNKIRDKT